ncbi:hypothetical protein Rhal01_03517 [Rubritalea halochordaticola]|uniref:HTH cro/C1-type domain-containing protein n=1 Tax=Rubritalea halochordaticola TaxID=714537 RepID=A0ABP9V3S9_9BACT
MPPQSLNCCGEHLAKLRASHKPPLTQELLATKVQRLGLDIDRAAIAKIETQKRRVYDTEIIPLAKALGVNPLTLLTGE